MNDFIFVEGKKDSQILSKNEGILLGLIYYSDKHESYIFESSLDISTVWTAADLDSIKYYLSYMNSKRLINEASRI